MTLGEDEPDHRGRSGLHLTGRELAGNPDVRILDVELVATAWHVLRRTTFEQRDAAGTWVRKTAETYDRGNGAVILLYDAGRRTVLLTRQFRYPVYVNGHPDGMLVEAAIGSGVHAATHELEHAQVTIADQQRTISGLQSTLSGVPAEADASASTGAAAVPWATRLPTAVAWLLICIAT